MIGAAAVQIATRMAISAGVVSVTSLAGCAVPTQMLAPPDDLADYRAFRMATHEGTRLERARKYLQRHPNGAWATEVRVAFNAEESAWFEAAKNSRALAREYLVDLPEGPHAEAARALLGLFNEHESDPEMLELIAKSRRTEAMLDLESERRKRVGEVVLEELAVLLDPAVWGATLDDPPQELARVLRGPVARTWGNPPAGLRVDEVFFVLPTPTETEARVAEVRLRLVIQRTRIVRGLVEGEDLFIRWAEANQTRVLDPTLPAERLAAANEVSEVLGGALEARMPMPRCAAQLGSGEILARDCDGWHASAHMGARAGDSDAIVVQGPRQ